MEGDLNRLLLLLPDDLLIEILEWLPVKSLLRFKCVSKWWYDQITSHAFTNNHLLKGTKKKKKKKKKKKMILLTRCLKQDDHDDSVFSFHDMDSPELEEIRPNLSISFLKDLSLPREFWLFGSCNGIVCFSRYENPSMFLCNPALNQFKQLPPYPLDCPQGCEYGISGAGFGVTCNNEFKVILIRLIYNLTIPEPPHLVSAHLYSSSTNLWKRIDSHPITTTTPVYLRHVFFNGACHWDILGCDPRRILSFDVNTEVFKHLELPDLVSRNYDLSETKNLIILNGCLAFVRHQGSCIMPDAVEVWAMEEYGIEDSWNFKFMIRPRLIISLPLMTWKSDECLLLQTSNKLVSICLNDSEITDFGIDGVVSYMCSVIHEDSLVSLD